jgi:hypothetical protein
MSGYSGQVLMLELAYGVACAATGALLLWLIQPRLAARMKPHGRHSSNPPSPTPSPKGHPADERQPSASPAKDRIGAAR